MGSLIKPERKGANSCQPDNGLGRDWSGTIRNGNRRDALQIARFGIVGAAGVVVDTSVLVVLVDVALLPSVVAKSIACETAIVHNFYWNDRWTFQSRAVRELQTRMLRFLKFNGIAMVGLALNVACFQLLILVAHLNIYIANLISIMLVAGVNYIFSRNWAWK